MNTLIQNITEKVTEGGSGNKLALTKILKNFNWLALENISRTFISLFVLAWVARYLGPEQFGLFNYAFAFVTLFSIFSTLGLDPILIKKLVNHKDRKNEFLGSALMMRTVGSVAMILAATAAAWFTSNGDMQILSFVLIFSLTFSIRSFEVISNWFQSEVKSKFAVYARSLGFFSVSLIKIGLILTQSPLEYFVWVTLLEQLIAISLLIYFYRKISNQSVSSFKVSKEAVKELTIDSWPLALGGVAGLIYMKIDQVMIANMLDTEQLGYYYSAVKLSEVWYFIPNAIAASVFPAILNAKRKDENLYNSRIQLLYDVLVWVGILLSLAVSLSAPTIVKIFGDQYVNSGPILRVHVWTNVFLFMGAIASRWVIAENLTKNALVRAMVGAALNVTLNLILIPRMGIMGAAIATLVSYSFVNYFSMFFAKSTYPSFAMATRAFNLFRVVGRLKDVRK